MSAPAPGSAPQRPRPATVAGVVFGLLALLLVTVAVYRPGLDGPFFLDDGANLPQTAIPELTLPALHRQFFADNWPYPGARGLTRVSFALTSVTRGYDPLPFKQQNLLLHLLNGLMVFWLLLVLFGARPPGAWGSSAVCPGEAMGFASLNPSYTGAGAWLALAVTAFWLLHPLQVSTVLYPVQRLVLLATLWMLAALLTYAKARLIARTHPWAGALLAGLGVPLFVGLGLVSKEIAVLTAPLLLLIEFYCFRFRFAGDEGRTPRAVVAVFLGLAVLPVLAGLAVFVLEFDRLVGDYAYRAFTMPERLLTEVHVLALYLKLILVPLPGAMSLFHDGFPITRQLDAGTLTLLGLYLALVIAALLAWRRAPWLGLGVLWFFACHALEDNVIGLELVFEHRNYLAMLGPALVLMVGLASLFAGERLVRLRVPVLVTLLALLAFNTLARATVWANWELMLITEYQRDPRSVRVLSGLTMLRFEQGDSATGFRLLAELETLSPKEAAPLLGHIELQCQQGAVDPDLLAAAESRLRDGQISPFTVNSVRALADRYLRGACPPLTAGDLERLFAAVFANPRLPQHLECPIRDALARQRMQALPWAEARAAVADVVEVCRRNFHYRPQTYDEAIGNLLTYAQVSGRLSAMLALLAELSSTPDRADITRAFPAWLPVVAITPEGIARLRAEGR